MGDSAAKVAPPVLKAFMRTVAGGTCLRVLAAAEMDRFGLVRFENFWREAGAFVRAVAKRLILAQTASAPSVGLAGLNVDRIRRSLRDDWSIHDGWFS